MSAAGTASIAAIIRQNRLRVLLQPVVDLVGRTVYGYEALCRGPGGTELESPLALFSAAEAAGLLPELDEQALRNALRVLPSLPAGTYLFVNVDPRTLVRKPDLVLRALEEQPCRGRLIVEVTEHGEAGLGWQEEPLERLRRLVERIALDDVGNRHAELHSLVAVRPAYVKMDRSLVQGVSQDRRKATLLRTLVCLGQRMGFIPVAEGVEAAPDLQAILRLGFRHAQGFVLGQPSPYPAPLSPEVLTALG
ncbi:MAG: EAL domain-containing protein [Bacillota bacterium]